VFVLRLLGRPYRFDLFSPFDIDAPTAEIGDLLGFGQTNLACVQRVLGAFQFSNVLRQNVVSAVKLPFYVPFPDRVSGAGGRMFKA